MIEGGKGRPGNNHVLYNLIKKYDTGWINRSDYTNVHIGSDKTLNVDSNVAHGLDAPLSELIVKVLVSTDGTDNNSWHIEGMVYNSVGNVSYGYTIYQVDLNNILIQTGINGLECQVRVWKVRLGGSEAGSEYT